MASTWERSDAVVAQRINVFQIGGIISKKIRVLDGEVVIIEEDGRALKTLERGVHKVGWAFSGSRRSATFVDTRAKTVRREVEGLWTRDDKEITGDVEMKLVVSDPEKLRSVMMNNRDMLTLEDVWEELKKEIAGEAVAPVVKKKSADQLQGDRKTLKEVQISVEVGLRKKLEITGLDLLSFSMKFILPEEYREYLKGRGRMKEKSEKAVSAEEEETRKAIHEREVGEIRGTVEGRDQVLDNLEKERMKREVEMEIEEEETQHDMRDAMEALRLKEIKDRQKMLKDSERKRLGMDSLKKAFSEGEDPEKRYDELQKMMEATEKKYLGRKIDKETLKKIMQKYEQEKTELEVKLKKGKKEV